jgi:HupE / UreJ protein
VLQVWGRVGGAALLAALIVIGVCAAAEAHGVDNATKSFLVSNQGVAIGPFLYIGAKHMVTGYDHLLFLLAVIFFLYRVKDVVVYVSCFTLGHSITLLSGVLGHISVNPYVIDAIIGFSVVYKGFDNLGGFRRLLGFQPNTKAAVLIFGLFHGFGLATKLQEFDLPKDGLLANLISFNVGVELGQVFALTFVLIAIVLWRQYESFLKFSTATNALIMAAGLTLIGYQVTGYVTT